MKIEEIRDGSVEGAALMSTSGGQEPPPSPVSPSGLHRPGHRVASQRPRPYNRSPLSRAQQLPGLGKGRWSRLPPWMAENQAEERRLPSVPSAPRRLPGTKAPRQLDFSCSSKRAYKNSAHLVCRQKLCF